jgi:hypothetical protein
MSFSALDAQKGGVPHFLGYHKQKSPPLGYGLPLTFECTKTGFVTLMKVPKKTQQEFKTKPSKKII